MKLYMFRTFPLSIIRSFSLYTQQWYTSYRFADSLQAGSWSHLPLCHRPQTISSNGQVPYPVSRLRLKCDGTRALTRFRLLAKRTSPFKSAEASVQSTTCSRGVRISSSNAGYTMFRGSVKGTGYPVHSPVSSSLPLPCVTVCHHISTGDYQCSFSDVKISWMFTSTPYACLCIIVFRHRYIIVPLWLLEKRHHDGFEYNLLDA